MRRQAGWLLWAMLLAAIAAPAWPQAVEEEPEEPIADLFATGEEEETAAPAEEEEAERTADETDPPPYSPPGVSVRTLTPRMTEPGPPPVPHLGDLPPGRPDPEIFFDPSTLPGPLPPPPTVTQRPAPGSRFTDIQADHLIQDRIEELLTLDGNVVVVYEDITIRAQQGLINEREESAAFWGEGGVEVESDDGLLNTLDLTLEFAEETKKLTAVGEVHAVIFAKEPQPLAPGATRRDKFTRAFRERETTLTGDVLHYWWGTREFHLWAEERPLAEVLQPGRTAKARDIQYTREPAELIRLEGAVELWQENGQWLYDHDLIERKDSKVLKALMAVPSTVTCDFLTHDEGRKLTLLDGAVHWVQSDKSFQAAKVTIDDSPRGWMPPEVPPAILRIGTGTEYLSPEQVQQAGIEFAPPQPIDPPGEPEVPTNAEYGGQLFLAEGAVYGQQSDGEWLFKYEVIEEDESEKVKADARRAAQGWADKVSFRLDTEDLFAEGNVRIRQPHQWGQAEAIEYRKGSERLTFNGDVRVRRRDKQTLLADEAVLALNTDVLIAWGHVETMLIVDTDDQEPSDIEGGLTLTGFPGGSDWLELPEGAAPADWQAPPLQPRTGEGSAPPADEEAEAGPVGDSEEGQPEEETTEEQATEEENAAAKETDAVDKE